MIAHAIKRLQYKLSKDKFYVDKQDREALNLVIRYYNETEKYNINQNELFAKLWINEFLQKTMLHDFSAKMALDELDRLLKLPIEHYFDTFNDEVKWIQFRKLCKELGIKDGYNENDRRIRALTDEETEENKAIISKYYEIIRNKMLSGYNWSEMKTFLEGQINRMIIEYGTTRD